MTFREKRSCETQLVSLIEDVACKSSQGKPEDYWSGIAHLSAEDMLKSVVIEEKKFKHSPRVGADNPFEYPMLPNFKVIGLLVPEKKIFKVFTIYGHGGHLSHVTMTV